MNLVSRAVYRLLLRDFVAPWQWPKGIPDNGWESLRMASPTGPPLAGVFGRAFGDSRGVIVAAHPVRPDAKGYFLRSGVAELLRESGFDVLLFDFNGFGDSPCRDFDYPQDVLTAARAAKAQSPGLPVIFFGACFGAGSGLAALTHPDTPFDAVVVEGAPASWHSYFAAPLATARSLRHRWIRWRGRAVLTVGALLLPQFARKYRTLDHLREARHLRGALFLYGTDDPLIPAHVGEALYAACREAWQALPAPPVCRLWVSPPTRHLMYYHADPHGYRATLLAFLDAVVGQRTPEAPLT